MTGEYLYSEYRSKMRGIGIHTPKWDYVPKQKQDVWNAMAAWVMKETES